MRTELRASIIINNHNYDKFLPAAIDSALAQTYEYVEVIVVDDGSTDRSQEIILSYGNKIIPVFKKNWGQASAFNAGFKKNSGDIIFFLDSDDVLYANAVQTVIPYFEDEKIAKVHWPLDIINETGKLTGEITPKAELPEGNFREHALHSGPPFFLNPPTSGNAWSRKFLESAMPMPEDEFKIGADTYLFESVAFFGEIKKIAWSLSCYRVHEKNNYFNKTFSQKLESELLFYNKLFGTLEKYCKKLGLHPDKDLWKEQSWFHRVANAIEDIKKVIPSGSTMILADDAVWDAGKDIEGRNVFPFIEKDGAYAGVPLDDQQAITELQRMYYKGMQYLVFTWITFWWLDEYAGLSNYLDDNCNCICKNERVKIFTFKK